MEKASPVAKAKKTRATSKSSSSAKLKVRAPKKTATKGAKEAKLAINNRTTKVDSMKNKLSKVEALHSTRKPTPPLSLEKKSPSKQLTLLSPFRLPLDGERVAAQAARYGGLALVAAGASLALFYAQLVELPVSAVSQLGATCAASDLLCLMREQQNEITGTNQNPPATVSSETTSQLTGTTDQQQTVTDTTRTTETNQTGTGGSLEDVTIPSPTPTTVNKLPAVFTIGSPEPLNGMVSINVTVAEAENVALSVYYDEWNRNLPLGSAKRENGAWIYQWNTANFENGRYRLKALIKNNTGTYEQVSDKFLVVKNEEEVVVEEPQPSAEPTGPLKVTLNSAGTHITVSQVYPEVTSSDVVKLYLIGRTDDVSRFVDDSYLFTQAYLKTNVTWKHTFNIQNFSAGEYKVKAERWRAETLLDTSFGEVTLTGSKVIIEPAPLPGYSKSDAVVTVRNASNLKGFVDVNIEATDANFVEVYAVNTASVNNLFLGLARKTSTGIWIFNWDTRQLPNSRYHLFARIGSAKGTYESNKLVVTIQNERVTAPTTSQVQELSAKTEQYESLMPDNIVVRNNFWNVTTATTTADKLNDFIETHKDRLQEEFQRFAAAVRSGNENALASANTRLIGLENEYRDTIDGEENFDELVAAYNEYIDNAKQRINTDVDKIEKIMTERDAEGLFSDTDWDGVTDFDEVYIYKTDPFMADTDGNGVPDGVAILNGLDPRSDGLGAEIVFESPQDVGIIRNDILHVESITAVTPDPESSPEVTTIAPAIIAGKALPNSYVTIFIFSTPVIVTVKTEADGSWQYRFEKELDNGEHSVYVALTDNSGRIIARSSPFRFIKEAQAYTTIDEALANYDAEETVDNDYSFFSSSVLYLVMSFAVVTIGLVLLLLGMYIDRRRKQEPEAPLAPAIASAV